MKPSFFVSVGDLKTTMDWYERFQATFEVNIWIAEKKYGVGSEITNKKKFLRMLKAEGDENNIANPKHPLMFKSVTCGKFLFVIQGVLVAI